MAGELVLITGATGFVGFAVLVQALKAGYRVRLSVRRDGQVEQLKSHQLVKPYADQIDYIVVPDITAKGAFDVALKDVIYVEHVASPLPKPNTNPERDIIIPAIHGTTSILESALKTTSVKRVVITSSVVALIADKYLTNGDCDNIYTANSRIKPLPSGPFENYSFSSAYRASKALALDATERFIADNKPRFSVVNVMPGFVLGANQLVTRSADLANGSNGLVVGLLKGESRPERIVSVVDVRDVARIHLEALDTIKVPGNKSFALDLGKLNYNEITRIAKENFPEAVADGILTLDSSQPGVYVTLDVSETLNTFGLQYTYEDAVKSVTEQYISLKKAEL